MATTTAPAAATDRPASLLLWRLLALLYDLFPALALWMLAGTLALMTGYAQAAADCPNRSLMARKLVSNLFFLSGHPHVSPPMRTMLDNLRTRWQLAAEAAPMAGLDRQPSPLWHAAPVNVQ